MLPDFLTGSYKRYKEDTSVFATWLSSTAQACGYRLPEPSLPLSTVQPTNGSGARLKGKARKEAKETAEALPTIPTSHVISTKDILIQAETIAKHKRRQKMPDVIYRVALRAISARRRCLAWFQQTRPEDESNSSHEHFVGVLEDALELLKLCIPHNTDASRRSDPVPDATLHNRFSLLDVEDIDEDLLDITTADIVIEKSKIPQNKPRAGDVYEIQMEPHMEVAFRLYCFFEDLRRIQGFLRDTWSSYAAGEMELMAASLTSNIAFELVRRTEEEMISNFPTSYRKDASYTKLAAILLDFQSGPTMHGDFIYNSTYSTLAKFISYDWFFIPSAELHYLFNPQLMPASGDWGTDDKILTQYLYEFKLRRLFTKKNAYFDEDRQDVLSRGLQCVTDSSNTSDIQIWLVFGTTILLDIWRILGSQAGLGYLELLRRGAKAKAILRSEYTSKSLEQEWAGCGNAEVLEVWKTIEAIETNPAICTKDVTMTKSVYPFITPGALSPKDAAIGCKVRGENGMHGTIPLHKSSASSTLKSTGSKPTDGLKLSVPATNKNSTVLTMEAFSSSIAKPGQSNSGVQTCSIDIQSSIEDIAAYITDRKISTEFIGVNRDPAFYDKHNPIYCGMESIQLTMNMEAAGMHLANDSLFGFRSVLAVCHLLNAARQFKLSQEPWKALDTVALLHINRIFGGAFPTTAREMFSRLCIVIGCPASTFARGVSVPKKLRKSSFQNRAKISHTATSKVLHRYFAEPDSTIEATLIEAEAQYLRDNKKQRCAAGSGIKKSKEHMTILEVLTKLRDVSNSDIEEMDIDYVGLHRLCSQLLERIAEKIRSELDIDHPEKQKRRSKSTQFQGLEMVINILGDISQWDEEQNNKKKTKIPLSRCPPQLSIAASVMQEFIQQEASKKAPVYQPFPIPNKDTIAGAEWLDKYNEAVRRRDHGNGNTDPGQTS